MVPNRPPAPYPPLPVLRLTEAELPNPGSKVIIRVTISSPQVTQRSGVAAPPHAVFTILILGHILPALLSFNKRSISACPLAALLSID